MTNREARREAEAFIATHNLTAMRVLFADLHGIPRGKVLSASEYLQVLEYGVRFSRAVLVRDVTGGRLEQLVQELGIGSPDILAVPDPSTYCVLPSQPPMGQVIADLFSSDGSPVPYAPRTVLRRVVDSLGERERLPRVASEIEFYVLKSDQRTPAYRGSQPCDVLEVCPPGTFLGHVLVAFAAMELPFAAVLREGGPSQFEVSLPHSPPLPMADHTLLAKLAIKDTACAHGLAATFMAKPFATQSGSGFLYCLSNSPTPSPSGHYAARAS